jgi:phage terminase large subunit-like protein
VSSSVAALLGNQRPKELLVPAAVRGDAEDAIFLASAYGLTPDDWQAFWLEAVLGRRANGRLAAPRVGLAVPRQNGKNGALEIIELFKMVGLGRKILHTAHEVKTARKAFLRLLSFFENPRQYPELAGLVRDIRKTNGQEAIVLLNGGSVEFIARSKGSGRGFTVDDLVMDEAQELTEDALAALLPTISAAPSGDPQQIMTGTPPGPAAQGEVFSRVRAVGLEGNDERLCWMAWRMENDADLDDPEAWADANPALGIRLGIDTIRDERSAMSDDTFGRERGGLWGDANTQRVISAATWADRADVYSMVTDRLALAVDVAPDRSVVSVGVAGQKPDGRWHVELDEQKFGEVGWVVPWIVRRCEANDIRAVVIDAMSPAASLIDELAKHKIKVTTTGPRDMAQACGSFYDGAIEGWLVHTDQPQLNAALGAARKRPLGDAWAWNRKSSALDITALVACTLALWGAQSSSVKRPGRGRGRVVGERRAVVLA